MPQPGACSIVCNSVFIALGSNATSVFGDPYFNLSEALRRLACDSLTISEVSIFYGTPAYPAGSGPDFVNAAARLETTLDAQDLLAQLHEVESSLGRVRTTRWGERSIDLDLIAFGETVHPDADTYDEWLKLPLSEQQKRAPDQLILPHPRLQDRAFVLGPLRDIAPNWRHPVLGKTIAQMFDALPAAERASLKPLPPRN